MDQLSVLLTVAVVVTSEQLDCISREIVANAASKRITKDAFRAQAPFLSEQIEEDADSSLLDYWGLSLNFDENVRATIVDPKILTAIGSLCKRQIRFGRAYHAGLMHTYGYLLSTLETPYGLKRDRWMKATIENGFKLPRHTLGAEPNAGTLLQNLTYFLGRLVFRDSESRLRQLNSAASEVAPCLRTYAYESLHIARIVENCTVSTSSMSTSSMSTSSMSTSTASTGGKRRVSLFTDLVKFLPRTRTQRSSSSLLLYSVSDPKQGGTRFVTAFRIGPKIVSELLAADRFGRRVSIRPCYNAYVPGFTNELPGSRRLA